MIARYVKKSYRYSVTRLFSGGVFCFKYTHTPKKGKLKVGLSAPRSFLLINYAQVYR